MRIIRRAVPIRHEWHALAKDARRLTFVPSDFYFPLRKKRLRCECPAARVVGPCPVQLTVANLEASKLWKVWRIPVLCPQTDPSNFPSSGLDCQSRSQDSSGDRTKQEVHHLTAQFSSKRLIAIEHPWRDNRTYFPSQKQQIQWGYETIWVGFIRRAKVARRV